MTSANTFHAGIAFDFRGQRHEIEETFDLEQLMNEEDGYASIYRRLAQRGNIGPYSYEFEVMLDQPLHFSHQQGLAREFVGDTDIDWAGFREQRDQRQVDTELETIARRYLGVDSLADEHKLKAALNAAWQAGKASASD